MEFKIKATTHAGCHLRKVHDISIHEQGGKTHAKKEGEAIGTQNIIGTFFKRPQPFNEHRFKSHLIEWVLRNRISFRQVETQPFRQMVEALRSKAANVLPSSANTLRKWCLIRFLASCTEVSHSLQTAKSKIHISSDLWSSPNGHAFLGIVAHWWDLHDALKSALIALPKLLGVHSGENIAFTTVEVLKQYEIQNNVGYFMFDNASNNDTAVEHINELLANLGINWKMSYDSRGLSIMLRRTYLEPCR